MQLPCFKIQINVYLQEQLIMTVQRTQSREKCPYLAINCNQTWFHNRIINQFQSVRSNIMTGHSAMQERCKISDLLVFGHAFSIQVFVNEILCWVMANLNSNLVCCDRRFLLSNSRTTPSFVNLFPVFQNDLQLCNTLLFLDLGRIRIISFVQRNC